MSQDKPIITRKAAKAAGLKKFFTGRPCIRGHLAERYVQHTDLDVRHNTAALGALYSRNLAL
jgi:hypothetical protein